MIITFEPLVAVLPNEGCIVARLDCPAMVYNSKQTVPSNEKELICILSVEDWSGFHHYLLSLLEAPLVYELTDDLSPEPDLQPIFDAMKGVISRY